MTDVVTRKELVTALQELALQAENLRGVKSEQASEVEAVARGFMALASRLENNHDAD